ncbi:hypothetical protein [Rossellomorea vietnamensis]
MRRFKKKVFPVVLSIIVAGSVILPNLAETLGEFDLQLLDKQNNCLN